MFPVFLFASADTEFSPSPPSFSLIIRRPPRSTLFPYTRSSDLVPLGVAGTQEGTGAARGGVRDSRSEEHTSELQSLRHLVCRLLLEKKNEDKELHTL